MGIFLKFAVSPPHTPPPVGQVVANNVLNAGSAVVSGHEVTAEAATRYWLADTDVKVAVSAFRAVALNHSTATTVCVVLCCIVCFYVSVLNGNNSALILAG